MMVWATRRGQRRGLRRFPCTDEPVCAQSGRKINSLERRAMGRLTTHVLDTSLGRPASGLTVILERIETAGRMPVTQAVTNEDGRLDAPLLAGDAFQRGIYEISFLAGAYLRRNGAALPEPPFLDVIPIRFGIADAAVHYHVPLLLSPYGYSTYRGS
jgi:5-hydroxyisourate hydrolase